MQAEIRQYPAGNIILCCDLCAFLLRYVPLAGDFHNGLFKYWNCSITPFLYIASIAGGVGAIQGFIEGIYGLSPLSLLSFLRSSTPSKENNKWRFHFLNSPIENSAHNISHFIYDISEGIPRNIPRGQ